MWFRQKTRRSLEQIHQDLRVKKRLHGMNDLNRSTEERLGGYVSHLSRVLLYKLHTSGMNSLYRNKYPDWKSAHERKSYIFFNRRFNPRLVWLKQLWFFDCLWTTPSTHEWSAGAKTVLEFKGSCFPLIPSPNMFRNPKRTGPTNEFQLWFCNTSQPKENHMAPKSTACSLWFDIFSGKRLGCYHPPQLTIIKLDTIPSIGISCKSCDNMINKIPFCYKKKEGGKKLRVNQTPIRKDQLN